MCVSTHWGGELMLVRKKTSEGNKWDNTSKKVKVKGKGKAKAKAKGGEGRGRGRGRYI